MGQTLSKGDTEPRSVKHGWARTGVLSSCTNQKMPTDFASLHDVVREAIHVNKCIEALSAGGALLKLRKGTLYNRHFRVQDGMTIVQEGSTKMVSSAKNITIDEIHEVRTGMKTETFNKSKGRGKFGQVLENQCFSLVHGIKRETLDLVATNQEVRDKWVKGLRGLVAKQKNSSIRDYQDTWVKEFFMKADKNNDGSLTLREIEKILPEMNIDIKKSHIRQLFDSANTDKASNRKGEQSLDREEFVAFCRSLQARPEVDALFEIFTDDGEYMTKADLTRFLKDEQKVDASFEYVTELINKFEPSEKARTSGLLSTEGFRLFLLDDDQLIMKPEDKKMFQDMTQPLTHYFLSSSHNTYLMQDQLRGPSSTEAYISALERGCRCVELDCWDGPDDEPIVYHGHTLTSKILFKDVIHAVNDYAFASSEYPLILSLENHCSVDQQQVMAKHMKEILKGKLLTEPLDNGIALLPSPEQLKGKILIKGKAWPAKPVGTEEDDDGIVSDEDEAAEIDAEIVQEQKAAEEARRKGLKLAPELGSLAIYMASTAFKTFEYSQQNCKAWQISSLAEKKFNDLHDNEGDKFATHCKTFPVRTFPAGTRTNSSNYNPCPAWACGAQIVALNYQTPGREMQLNYGKFSINGQTGYILKPEFLRNKEIKFDPRGPFPKDWEKRLTVTVISGYQLPKIDKRSEVVDPFVKISIYGVNSDKQEKQTKVIKNNGFNPVWNETFQFTVKCPELALVRFSVKDDGKVRADADLANFTIPFNSIQQGHRHIPLKDDRGNFTKHSYLATHIEIEDTGKSGGVGSPRSDKMPKIHNSLLHKRLNYVKASRTDGSMTTEETKSNRLKIQGNPYEVFFIERYETTV
ncbi:1-phosphatidylinositol 4,5-bisphosphate phosphodiesterase delta-1-like isoform X2 [Lineus longissimus]|uniref:1-phosphatidylinositol 4,5-bisphosphate phosphodiesterase delta-1-like isoform X2 n=1 Tax=Lineus longissimus TaxID=88925 RepID=UPI00315D3AF0